MDPRPSFGLVWADAPFADCRLTGERLVVREARVECVGTGEPPETVRLGYSAGADCWYAPVDRMLDACERGDVSPVVAGPFRVDGAEREAAMALGETLLSWAVFAARMSGLGASADVPAPTFREVRGLPVADETWELAFDEADVDGDEPVAVLLVTDGLGLPRTARVHEGRLLVSDLAAAVRAATRSHNGSDAVRPRDVRVEDARLAAKLKKELAPTGIRVRRGDTPTAYLLLDDLLAQLEDVAAATPLPPLFADDSDADLAAFFDAARRFYAARPWERLDGRRFLAVQDADAGPGAPWTYANVLGQMDEEHGLSLFTDWADACAAVHDRSGLGAALFADDPDDDLDDFYDDGPAAPVLEGVTLFPPSILHAADRERLEALGVRETAAQQIALPTRFEDGALGPIRVPLPLLTAVLAALPDVLAKRRAPQVTSIKTTVEAAGTRLALRYPATGAEGLAPGLGDVRLTIENDGARESGIESLTRGERLIVEGPAAASAYAAGKAIRQAYKTSGRWGFLTAIVADGRDLWRGRAYATEAAPTLDDLLRAEQVVFDMGMSIYPVRVERLEAGAAPEVRAELLRADPDTQPSSPKPMFGKKKKSDPGAAASFDPRSMEKRMRDLTKLLQDQDFQSEEEAETFMAQLTGKRIPEAPVGNDPVSRAQDLVEQAYDAPTREEAARMGRRALELDPDCADAYVLLAEAEARTVPQARDLYRQGVEAGERALGPEAFTEDVGHFWGILETRPYMRARQGLAETLWTTGERDAAVEHLQDMLRLNPGDNQGLRYTLSDFLLATDRNDDLEALLGEYDEGSAHWLFNTALLRFRQHGESDAADAALGAAVDQNPHVARYLMGKKKLPKTMPAYRGFGDETEAVEYASAGTALWRGTTGALGWLRRQTA